MADNRQIFIDEMIRLSGVSKEYADACWHTLNDACRAKPAINAYRYCLVKNLLKEENFLSDHLEIKHIG